MVGNEKTCSIFLVTADESCSAGNISRMYANGKPGR
jgi:hypothetical protein